MRAPSNSIAFSFSGIALAVSLLSGCAIPAGAQRDPRDPFERVNRTIFHFNERVDDALLKPTARAYRTVVPQFVRNSVSNVFSNFKDVRNVVNNSLQGKFTTAYSDFGRIAINSTLGVLGLFDIASEAGIEKHDEDFGQTLGWWGVPAGPFIMLPLFGPSTGRDTVGFAVDWLSDPVTYIDPTSARYQLGATRLVNRRAELLGSANVLETVFDPYQFLRDGYMQRRRNLIFDGQPPPDKDAIQYPRPESAPAKP